jgi:hypothetical protein
MGRALAQAHLPSSQNCAKDCRSFSLDAPPQLNPFPKAHLEGKPKTQTQRGLANRTPKPPA